MTEGKDAAVENRLRVTLPGRANRVVTWEELAALEREHGTDEVKKWIKGGALVFPKKAEEPKSPEFVRHMEDVRRRVEQREYMKMMGGIFPTGAYYSGTIKSLSPEHTGTGASAFQMGVIGMNMVIGIGCAYVAADYLAGQYGLSPTQRALVSILAMVAVMMIEMVLFIIRAFRFDEMDNKRRRKMETTFAPAAGLGIPLDNLIQDPLVKKTN